MEAAARPFPRDERTPPVIKMNFVFMFIKSYSDKGHPSFAGLHLFPKRVHYRIEYWQPVYNYFQAVSKANYFCTAIRSKALTIAIATVLPPFRPRAVM
jgi:hypothetical protein